MRVPLSAEAAIPVTAYRELERSRRCVADAGTLTCTYQFDKPYRFSLAIEGVGAATPTILAEESSPLIFPRYKIGGSCVEVVSILVPTAGISLKTGAFHRVYADCEAATDGGVHGGADGGK